MVENRSFPKRLGASLAPLRQPGHARTRQERTLAGAPPAPVAQGFLLVQRTSLRLQKKASGCPDSPNPRARLFVPSSNPHNPHPCAPPHATTTLARSPAAAPSQAAHTALACFHSLSFPLDLPASSDPGSARSSPCPPPVPSPPPDPTQRTLAPLAPPKPCLACCC